MIMRTKNKFELRGFVGNDPQLKETENGKVFTNLRIATGYLYGSKDGDKTKVTDWHTVTLWNGRAKVAEKYIKKGALISVEGRIKPRTYEDKDGNTIYTTDLVVDVLDIILNKEQE